MSEETVYKPKKEVGIQDNDKSINEKEKREESGKNKEGQGNIGKKADSPQQGNSTETKKNIKADEEKGTVKFSKGETWYLLTLFQEILLVTHHKYLLIKRRFESKYPENNCTHGLLCTKF